MTPTATIPPTSTPTPYFWPTPTPWPTDTTYSLTMPPVNPIFVQAAEETVQVYNKANSYGMMDNMITFILMALILAVMIRFYWKMRKLGGRDDV